MNMKLTLAVVTSVASLTSSLAMAQGKGQGLNRSLNNPGAARALSGQSNGLGRAGGGLSRGMGLNKGLAGAPRFGAKPVPELDPNSVSAEGDQGLANQQRILDHRRQQAEHLRATSERNGNARLLETADRMDQSAVRNFERQTGTVVLPSPPGDGTVTDPNASTESAPTSTAVPTTTNAKLAKPKGFWLRSR